MEYSDELEKKENGIHLVFLGILLGFLRKILDKIWFEWLEKIFEKRKKRNFIRLIDFYLFINF